MTNKTISDLTAADSLDGTELLHVSQGGNSRKVAANAIAESSIQAISETIADTAVDVFVYDTSQDSDGGAWRKRTQHTSWYNETLNTATRGGRREFPAVAVIVAEADKVTIYDGDDPALPMWMVFPGLALTTSYIGYDSLNRAKTGIAVLNGVVVVASGTGGCTKIDFPVDAGTYISNNIIGPFSGNISSRASTQTVTDYGTRILSNIVNDVAITTLPDAPIDPATGLPVPTIAVATDGSGTYSTSIITHDGSVYDVADDTTGTAVSVSIGSDYALTVLRSDGTAYVWDDIGAITADGASPDDTLTSFLGTPTVVVAA